MARSSSAALTTAWCNSTSADAQAAYRHRYRVAFERVVDRALADRVDLVLIAGDLFDHNRVPDEEIEFASAQLDRLSTPVVVLPGNHDVLRAGAIYERRDIGAPGSHVRVIRRLGGEIVELPEHPWFVASQFHPEFKSRPTRPAPLFREFVAAALERARSRSGDAVRTATR